MNIYVTGATGYVGSLLCEAIKDDTGIAPITIGRSPHSGIHWDMNDARQKLSIEAGSVVIHLAGITNESQYSAEEMHQLNYESTRLLAEQCKRQNIDKFIYMSSCSVYSPTNKVIDEKTPFSPVGPYGSSKLMAEMYLKELFRENSNQLVILRPSSIYGLEQTASQSTLSMLKDRVDSGIFVFLGKGRNAKSFVHVKDVVDAIVYLTAPPQGNNLPQTADFILASESFTTKELIYDILSAKKTLPIPLGPVKVANSILLHLPVVKNIAVKIQNALNKWVSNFNIDGSLITRRTNFRYQHFLER